MLFITIKHLVYNSILVAVSRMYSFKIIYYHTPMPVVDHNPNAIIIFLTLLIVYIEVESWLCG